MKIAGIIHGFIFRQISQVDWDQVLAVSVAAIWALELAGFGAAKIENRFAPNALILARFWRLLAWWHLSFHFAAPRFTCDLRI
jgi:hypothetical protein